MSAWLESNRKEEAKIWKKFKQKFQFNPSSQGQVFFEPSPSITYKISDIYHCNDEEYDVLQLDLHKKMLQAMRCCLAENKLIYALDWQPPCYSFNPHANIKNMSKWNIDIIPNGDCIIYIAQDFSFGALGNCWENSICVFGEKFLNILLKNKPQLFIGNILRKKEIE